MIKRCFAICAFGILSSLAWGSGVEAQNAPGIVCIGDSNTFVEPSWCDMLAEILGPYGWGFRNYAQAFAVAGFDEGYPNGLSQLRAALADEVPDAVVMSFGTNDAILSYAVSVNLNLPLDARVVDRIVADYEQLATLATAAGARVFVALTPPVITGPQLAAPINGLIAVLDYRVRRKFHRRKVIDFASSMNFNTDYGDSLHFNASGQLKRALAACRVIVGASDVNPARICVRGIRELSARLARGGEVATLPRLGATVPLGAAVR